MFGEECKETDPLCKGHRKFEPGKSSTFKGEKRGLEIRYAKGQVLGTFGRDDVFITNGLETKKQLFGSAIKINTRRIGYDGILGNNY